MGKHFETHLYTFDHEDLPLMSLDVANGKAVLVTQADLNRMAEAAA